MITNYFPDTIETMITNSPKTLKHRGCLWVTGLEITRSSNSARSPHISLPAFFFALRHCRNQSQHQVSNRAKLMFSSLLPDTGLGAACRVLKVLIKLLYGRMTGELTHTYIYMCV